MRPPSAASRRSLGSAAKRTRMSAATCAHTAATSAGPAAASFAETSLIRSWIGESMAAWK